MDFVDEWSCNDHIGEMADQVTETGNPDDWVAMFCTTILRDFDGTLPGY